MKQKLLHISWSIYQDIIYTGRNEGISRELVNRIQNIRKDSGFEVTDKIKVELQKNEALEKALKPILDQLYDGAKTLLIPERDPLKRTGFEIKVETSVDLPSLLKKLN